MNIPSPEKVMYDPQTAATRSGVVPDSLMGMVNRAGT